MMRPSVVEKNTKCRSNLKCICSESVCNVYSFLFSVLWSLPVSVPFNPTVCPSSWLAGEQQIKQMDLNLISLLSFMMCNVL